LAAEEEFMMVPRQVVSRGLDRRLQRTSLVAGLGVSSAICWATAHGTTHVLLLLMLGILVTHQVLHSLLVAFSEVSSPCHACAIGFPRNPLPLGHGYYSTNLISRRHYKTRYSRAALVVSVGTSVTSYLMLCLYQSMMPVYRFPGKDTATYHSPPGVRSRHRVSAVAFPLDLSIGLVWIRE
jgi:hypothetical protein